MALTVRVKDGTPNHSGKSLCMSCKNAHIMQGDRTSDLTIWCEAMFEKPIKIESKIIDCGSHKANKDASFSEMQKIAYVLETKKGKPIGFVSMAEHKQNIKNDAPDVDTHDDDY
jgi:hypothetical protein